MKEKSLPVDFDTQGEVWIPGQARWAFVIVPLCEVRAYTRNRSPIYETSFWVAVLHYVNDAHNDSYQPRPFEAANCRINLAALM
jgi:hypothetical protein